MQPDLPRPLQLTAPEWWVVSDAVITNPCRKVFDEEKQKKSDLKHVQKRIQRI